MITVRQLVTSLDRDGIERFTLAVRHAVNQQAQRHGQTVEEFLNARGMRGLFRRATNFHLLMTEFEGGDCEVNPAGVDLLLSCLRRLNITVDQLISNDLRSSPWDKFCSGDSLMTVLGSKLVEGPLMSQYYVSHRDTESKNSLHNYLRDRQRLAFDSLQICASIETSPAEGQANLNEYRSRANMGMIVVFGSSVVNSLTSPMARQILSNAGLQKSPAWFEWPCDWKELGLHHPLDPIIQRRSENACGVQLAEPVQTPSGEMKSFFPRVGRHEAMRRFQQGDQGPFDDAGLLLLDASSTPMLCLIAGHGGCATQAALQALLDEETISSELARAEEGGSILGPGRLMQVIEVKCSKRTGRPHVDDLGFGPNDWCAYTLRPAKYVERRTPRDSE